MGLDRGYGSTMGSVWSGERIRTVGTHLVRRGRRRLTTKKVAATPATPTVANRIPSKMRVSPEALGSVTPCGSG
jgi:hypothetical protein